jgi:hypothetical protein
MKKDKGAGEQPATEEELNILVDPCLAIFIGLHGGLQVRISSAANVDERALRYFLERLLPVVRGIQASFPGDGR